MKNKIKGERQSICRECKREEDKKRYERNRGMWIYYITINGVIRWVGHTCNLYNRINSHKNGKRKGCLVYEAKQRGIELRDVDVKVYSCDIRELGLNITGGDLQYYESYFIKKNKDTVFNVLDNGKLEERERFIDEVPLIPLEKFPFTFYKSIGNQSNKQ